MIEDDKKSEPGKEKMPVFLHIRFRCGGQQFTASSRLLDLKRDEVVMVNTDHGLEPAQVRCPAPGSRISGCCQATDYVITRRASSDECSRYQNLAVREDEARRICLALIEKHQLVMNLVQVEYFFNGSKIIFYFTAVKRVDFRALVKDLVQEFRTRVEMRQIGVRHETRMIGGLGICGRELCCSSYMKGFNSVSIKMAKDQDLSLNPAKISGLCNRLLCCLNYECDSYKKLRNGMPKPGSNIIVDHCKYKVKRQVPLRRSLIVGNEKGEEQILSEQQWLGFEPARREKNKK
ncbi:MAG: hypothetical protein CSB24_04110 [Deltaproteobacteria bacterium]|nr:MAG: hypothetical protein CSB24_04110 [Deltaproteobacteria bacterium]